MQAEIRAIEEPVVELELEGVVRELAPRLLRFAVAVVGDRTLAEDASQEALVALVRRWRTLGPPESAESFVFTIARRRARRSRWSQRLMIALSDASSDFAWDARTEESLAVRQRLDATLAAIHRLSGADREALSLVVGGEVDLATGAEILGISVSALKMRVHRARKRLKRIMKEEECRDAF